MRLGEDPPPVLSLVLLHRDPAAVEREWEQVLRRLEDAGFAGRPRQARRGGLQDVWCRRATVRRRAHGSTLAWQPSARAGIRASALPAVASLPSRWLIVARPDQILLVAEKEEESCPSSRCRSVLPPHERSLCRLKAWACAGSASSPRFRAARCQRGWVPDGRKAWHLARGGRSAKVRVQSRRQSPPKCSSSRKPSGTSSRCAERSARCSSACSPAPNEPDGRF